MCHIMLFLFLLCFSFVFLFSGRLFPRLTFFINFFFLTFLICLRAFFCFLTNLIYLNLSILLSVSSCSFVTFSSFLFEYDYFIILYVIQHCRLNVYLQARTAYLKSFIIFTIYKH